MFSVKDYVIGCPTFAYPSVALDINLIVFLAMDCVQLG